MNILIVHAGKGFYGGAEEVIRQLCLYLERHNHNVNLVCTNNPRQLETWIQLPKSRNLYELRQIVRVRMRGADVINVHNFPATLMPFPTRKPIVWMCNEPPELFTNWKRKPVEAFNRWWVRRSNMKVVVADDLQAVRFERLYGIEPTVIPYGIDYEFWSQGERSEAMKLVFGRTYGPKERPLKLLQVGTITPYKNQLESIKTLGKLRIDGIDATLTLAGSFTADADYFMELQEGIKTISKEFSKDFWKRIKYTGQVTHEEIRQLYNEYDILLHPVKGQGGWLVPFEAMCAGLPVIVSPRFTGADLIRTHKLGAVTDNYVEAIKEVYEGQYTYSEYLGKAKEWIKENLTWEKFGEGILKVFEEAVRCKLN